MGMRTRPKTRPRQDEEREDAEGRRLAAVLADQVMEKSSRKRKAATVVRPEPTRRSG